MNWIWAKLDRDAPPGQDRPWLSLVDHSADVAAVFEAMLRVPLVERRLARLAGVAALPSIWRDRLSAHVALHDFGKANRGFQARSDPAKPKVGHVGPGLALIYTLTETKLAARLCEVLPLPRMNEWGALEAALRAVAAHHGRPIADEALRDHDRFLRQYWAPSSGDDPIATLDTLGAATRDWFPAAWVAGGSHLPDAAPFWHAFAGLVMLADWIGSDARAFPLTQMPDRMAWARDKAPGVLVEYGFDPTPKRSGLPPVSFASVAPFEPHPIQQAAGEAEGRVVVLEAETGMGKTEAALYRFARLFAAGEVDGLYFALPTRVAARSLYDRVRLAVERCFADGPRPAVILAVPGYAKVDGVAGKPLPGFQVLWDDDAAGGKSRERWAAEHPKRFLAGTIAVGTIDQALLGAIEVRHAHMRSSSLLRHLLVVDEVHASDAYMERLLVSLLDQHARAGGHAMLLSATLGAEARQRLLGANGEAALGVAMAEALPYPAISTSVMPQPQGFVGAGREKKVQLDLDERVGDPDAIARLALDAAERGAKVLVVRNLHRTAVATAEALLKLAPEHPAIFRCKGVPTLHHGRFAREDRELLDSAIENQMKNNRASKGLVLIGTQTLEQSLDICADLLITDLCPADVLLQRIGRLHRHARNARPTGFEEARAVVLSPPDLTSLLLRPDFGMGGRHGPYRDLVMLEATRRLVAAHPTWHIPLMNRLLVERATHSRALDALGAELSSKSPQWPKNRRDMEGSAIADEQIAAQARLKWNQRFDGGNLAFAADDAVYGTRLGARDVVAQLPAGTIGPFGREVRTLSIPNFWIGGLDISEDVTPTIVCAEPGAFRFEVGQQRYRYDRLGLHKQHQP